MLQVAGPDNHVSDIISVYEQKLRSQKTRESHLDDLVQAKTMALSQADRLIQQYKNRLAQTDAEVCFHPQLLLCSPSTVLYLYLPLSISLHHLPASLTIHLSFPFPLLLASSLLSYL